MSKLSKLRQVAFERQCGRCFYCGLPMIPPEALDQFATKLSLSSKLARGVAATAEHLHAQCDGGRDTAANIAAAHRLCNERRHHLRPAPDPARYAAMVRLQIAQGGWLKKTVRQGLSVHFGPRSFEPVRHAALHIDHDRRRQGSK